MLWGAIALAIFVGGLMPLQAGINAQLSRQLTNPFVGALLSFTVGTITLLCLSLTQGLHWEQFKKLGTLPPYLFLGGVFGASFVGSSIYLIPKLGATAMIASLITGQLIISVLIDHYGSLGLSQHLINPWRLAGVALLFSGLLLIIKN